ncbi:hypothetical protein L7F22_006140 [Adiantum nelumboides]|nr:hypothetical protein [Adiantum nelumboides]
MEMEQGKEATNMGVELVQHQVEEPWLGCRLARRKMPIAPPGFVVVRMRCRSVNPSDVACIKGEYLTWKPISLPAVVGLEGMGVIHQVGEGVSGFEIGQRVFPMGASDNGLWQDYVVAPAAGLVPLPPSISDDVAAQFLINPWTVVGILEVLKVPKGDYFLQLAAIITSSFEGSIWMPDLEII